MAKNKEETDKSTDNKSTDKSTDNKSTDKKSTDKSTDGDLKVGKTKLESVEYWANQMFLKPWELAGLRENAKIKPGKLLSKDDFKKLLSAFRNQPLGG